MLAVTPIEGGRTRIREMGVGYGMSAEDDGRFRFFEKRNASTMTDLETRAARRNGSGPSGR